MLSHNFGQNRPQTSAQLRGVRRIPKIQARLDAWAEWRASSGGSMGGGGSVIGYLMDLAAGKRVHEDDGSAQSVVPVDSIECSITHEAVLALPDELRQAVVAWHCASSGTMEEVAKRHGMVKATLWRRLAHADWRIREWLRARQTASL